MPALSGPEMLRVWEAGQGRHPVDQALAILTVAVPETTRDELASLTVGQRDAYLLAVYEHTFGARIEGLIDCPQCRDTLEFTLRVADIRQPLPDGVEDQAFQLIANGYELRFRLPNSFDLAAIARPDTMLPAAHASSDITPVRNLLVQRCLLEATHEGTSVTAADLPESIIEALTTEMAGHDPQAEVTFNFTCPDCDHAWQALFDIVTFLWSRISAQAQRLLVDVHTLARAYGWPEADILTMSNTRRQFYLNQVS